MCTNILICFILIICSFYKYLFNLLGIWQSITSTAAMLIVVVPFLMVVVISLCLQSSVCACIEWGLLSNYYCRPHFWIRNWSTICELFAKCFHPFLLFLCHSTSLSLQFSLKAGCCSSLCPKSFVFAERPCL